MQDSYSILYKNHAVKQYFLPVLSWGETCRSAFYHMEPATQCQRSGSYGRTEGEETHLQRSSFLLFHRIKNRKSLLDSRWSIHLFFDQPLCCYLSLYRYNHSNVLDPDPKVIILVISRFFEEKTESVWCFSTFYQKVYFISLKLIMIMFYLSWNYIEKDRFSPIDVNMPDLKGMLLVWKPTGPENTSQYYIIKIKIINI